MIYFSVFLKDIICFAYLSHAIMIWTVPPSALPTPCKILLLDFYSLTMTLDNDLLATSRMSV